MHLGITAWEMTMFIPIQVWPRFKCPELTLVRHMFLDTWARALGKKREKGGGGGGGMTLLRK